MLYEYEKVKDNPWIIKSIPTGRCTKTGKTLYDWTYSYPYALYWDEFNDYEYGQRHFDYIGIRRFMDRNLAGDVIYHRIDRSYSYKYYLDPKKTFDYSHYEERWYFKAFNFELLCDYYLVKNTFNIWDALPPKHTRKPHHDWKKNEHVDVQDCDKYWDPEFKTIQKLRKNL